MAIFAAKQLANETEIHPFVKGVMQVRMTIVGTYYALPDILTGMWHNNVVVPLTRLASRAAKSLIDETEEVVIAAGGRAKK